MNEAPPTHGVSNAPAPPVAVPAAKMPIVATPVPDITLRSPWSRPAQRVIVGLLVLALSLLSWRLYAAGRWAARPTTLELEAAAFKVDLNTADHSQLLQLPGVGESLATRIEAYRRQYGGFRDVEDLRHVSGIGPATLERLRPFVYAQPPVVSDGEDWLAPKDPEPALRSRPAPMKLPLVKSTGNKKAEALTGQLDINIATSEELQLLPGIGPGLSARIVAARTVKPFQTVDDLRHVHGIGAKTLERLRPHVMVGGKEKRPSRADGAGSP
jgi:competence protein ComEA